jgi:hypothetical protein
VSQSGGGDKGWGLLSGGDSSSGGGGGGISGLGVGGHFCYNGLCFWFSAGFWEILLLWLMEKARRRR